jgi:uncharacterized protein DUF3696
LHGQGQPTVGPQLLAEDLDEYGNIRNWPTGFFGDAFAETAAMVRAAMDRKQQAAA